MNLMETKQDTSQDRAMVRMRVATLPAHGPGGLFPYSQGL